MQIPSEEPEFDFFFTSDDLDLISKALFAYTHHEDTTIQELVDSFPLLNKVQAISHAELDVMAASWNEPGVEE